MLVTVEKVDTFNLRNLVGHHEPEAFLREHEACVRDSTAIWLARADGVDACAVGVIPYGSIFSSKAYLWLLHTRLCEQHPLRFVRWSRKVLSEIQLAYPTLVGLCRCDHPHSQAWLEWLGAKFDRTSTANGCYRFRID